MLTRFGIEVFPGLQWVHVSQSTTTRFTDLRRLETVFRWKSRHIDSDYGEVKDMGKAFLTLITAVFIASITFSEKIIDFKIAPKISAVAMFTSWILLLVSVLTCGVGLAMNLSSLFNLKYAYKDPYELLFDGLALFFASGLSFALGLATMLVAALPVQMEIHAVETSDHPVRT